MQVFIKIQMSGAHLLSLIDKHVLKQYLEALARYISSVFYLASRAARYIFFSPSNKWGRNVDRKRNSCVVARDFIIHVRELKFSSTSSN